MQVIIVIAAGIQSLLVFLQPPILLHGVRAVFSEQRETYRLGPRWRYRIKVKGYSFTPCTALHPNAAPTQSISRTRSRTPLVYTPRV